MTVASRAPAHPTGALLRRWGRLLPWTPDAGTAHLVSPRGTYRARPRRTRRVRGTLRLQKRCGRRANDVDRGGARTKPMAADEPRRPPDRYASTRQPRSPTPHQNQRFATTMGKPLVMTPRDLRCMSLGPETSPRREPNPLMKTLWGTKAGNRGFDISMRPSSSDRVQVFPDVHIRRDPDAPGGMESIVTSSTGEAPSARLREMLADVSTWALVPFWALVGLRRSTTRIRAVRRGRRVLRGGAEIRVRCEDDAGAACDAQLRRTRSKGCPHRRWDRTT
jgi:hypothetical protein